MLSFGVCICLAHKRRWNRSLVELSDFVAFCIIKNYLTLWLSLCENVRIFPEKQGEQIKDFKVIPGIFSALPKV